MAILNFPSNPSLDDTYTENGLTWRWNGEAWDFEATAPTVDHGSLTGLADDDHTQYLLVDGSRSATSFDVTNNLIVNGNLGVGVSSPGAILDVDGTGSGVSLKIRNGNSAAGGSAIQELFTYSGVGDYGHNIRTQHSSATNADNTIDFYLWTTTDSDNTPGSTKVLTIDGAGDVTVSGDIIVGGTVDGRDIATDGTKLDGIETGATNPGTDVNTIVTTTTDTLDAGDVWKLTQYSNASLVTVTVPTGTFSAGDWFLLQSTGAGGLTLSTTGLTVNALKTKITQHEALMVVFTGSNTISVFGGTS